jgi:hypothetical protein
MDDQSKEDDIYKMSVAWKKCEMYKKNYSKTPKGSCHLEGLGVDRKIISKQIGEECDSGI